MLSDTDDPEVFQKIKALQTQIFQHENELSVLRAEVPERTIFQKARPYLFLLFCFIILQFMQNWLAMAVPLFYYELLGAGLLVAFGFEWKRNRKKSAVVDQFRWHHQQIDRLEKEILAVKEDAYYKKHNS